MLIERLDENNFIYLDFKLWLSILGLEMCNNIMTKPIRMQQK